MLLLLCRQGAWPNKRPRPMPAGPGGKDVVVEFLARDSFHGPAEAGHVVAVEVARRFDHAAPIPRPSRKIKGCAEVGCTLEASPSLQRIRSFDATVHAPYARGIPKRTFTTALRARPLPPGTFSTAGRPGRADRLRASTDVRRSGTNADNRISLTSLGRI